MMGMTASSCSTTLLEEPFAFAADPERDCEFEALRTSDGGDNFFPGILAWVEGEEEDAPNFGTLPQAGLPFSTDSKVFHFTLQDFQDSISTRARSSPLVGLAAEGRMGETFIVEGGKGLKTTERADLELEEARNIRLDQLRVGTRWTLNQRLCYDVIFRVEIDSST